MNSRRFLVSWTAASAGGSLLGLGVGGFIGLMGLHGGLATAIPSALVFCAVITLSVGMVQGAVLAARFTDLSAVRWAALTGIGMLGAWILIAYPVKLLTSVDADPAAWGTALPLGAGIGLVVGVLVSSAQWLELRRHAERAARSIPVLAVAWTLGALFLFLGNGLVYVADPPAAVAVGAGVLLLAAALVALLQGIGLLRILRT